jgi:hypothetical protein
VRLGHASRSKGALHTIAVKSSGPLHKRVGKVRREYFDGLLRPNYLSVLTGTRILKNM